MLGLRISMAAKHHYEVLVGDTSVYRSTYHETSVGKRQAVTTYNDYVKKSKEGVGWASGQGVILLQDEKPVRRFIGYYGNPNRRKGMRRRRRNPKVSGVKFTLKRVPINRQGYDSSGRYWGTGAPLYYYEDYETGDISGYLRAHSKADAVQGLANAVKYKI